jgi:AcrR family transcriptional regulator
MTTASGQHPRRILSPKERRQRNREEMSTVILETARDIMREEGVAALNLSEVARRIGVTTAALYRYFPNKFALYDALFCLGVRRFRETMEAVWQAHAPNWELLHVWFETQLAFAKEYPELYQLMAERPVPGFVPSEESMEESRALLAAAVGVLKKIIDAGVIAPGFSPERAFDLFIVLLQGLISQHLANEPQLPPGEGRFGSLIPDVMAMLKAAWAPADRPEPIDTGPDELPACAGEP